ncbi:MAG: DUF1822 family protein [Microcoleaceae cyanobacterium]
MTPTRSQALTVLLEKHAHVFAERFALEQANPQKGQQVYLNTLAIYAVHSYLKWLGIRTNLEQADSWHSGLRAMFNIADLVLPGVGKLECCPVMTEDETVTIPTAITADRIGYVAVEFGQDLNQVQLLGFFPVSKDAQFSQSIPRQVLRPLDELIETIAWHERWVDLWNKLKGWELPQALILIQGNHSSLLASMEPMPTRTKVTRSAEFERTITRGKLIALDSKVSSTELASPESASSLDSQQKLLLMVSVIDCSPEEVDISLRVHSYGEIQHLPSGLQIVVVDESGTPQMKAEVKEADDWIQLEFSCKSKEKFNLQVCLENQTITEEFEV